MSTDFRFRKSQLLAGSGRPLGAHGLSWALTAIDTSVLLTTVNEVWGLAALSSALEGETSTAASGFPFSSSATAVSNINFITFRYLFKGAGDKHRTCYNRVFNVD